MPSRIGAQRASRRSRSFRASRSADAGSDPRPLATPPPSPRPRSARPRGILICRSLVAAFLLGLLGFGAFGVSQPAAALAGTSAAAGMKVVIIVGPASSSTGDYISQANVLASQATAEGMRVTKIYTPNAYWSTVKKEAQNANLLVYFGHGNGYPNPYRSELYETSEDGFGLNPEGQAHGTTSPTEYHGADDIRASLNLAKNAVVLLYRLCYASGNAESGMRPMNPNSSADRNTAFQRVDNFAAGFLKIGAGAVFSWGWPQKINLPQQLAESNRTMDRIFETKGNDDIYPTAFMGTNDYRVQSRRTDGAWLHLDPSPTYGYLRALTGDLEMTAADWRGDSGPRDTTAPSLTGVSAGTSSASTSSAQGQPVFSPNGDGIGDRLPINFTMSESGTLDTAITDSAGNPVLDTVDPVDQGPGTVSWDGTDGEARVPDGAYTVTLTPTDRAGNVGTPRTMTVWVLTALSSPGSSTSAIEVQDSDDLASSVRFNATLTEPADITWTVVNSAGNVVRDGPVDPGALPTDNGGALLWNWDGMDDDGNAVPDGTYRGIVSATTDTGTISYARSVYVGAFQFHLSDTTLKRGQKVKITAYNTEVLSGPLLLTIKQQGLAPYIVTLTKVNDHRYTASVKLHTGGAKGRSTWTLAGVNMEGGAETFSFIQRIR